MFFFAVVHSDDVAKEAEEAEKTKTLSFNIFAATASHFLLSPKQRTLSRRLPVAMMDQLICQQVADFFIFLLLRSDEQK